MVAGGAVHDDDPALGAEDLPPLGGDLDGRPSSKQVAFAEKLARIKRRAVPDE